MADPKSYSDDNTDGFSSSSAGVVADDTGDTTGNYDDWDWKKIMAAITGGAAYSDPSIVTHPSDPQTIQTAADTLHYTQQVLDEAARSISAQTEALTGEHGPWQGQAAQALNKAMSGVAQQTQHMADRLSGGVTGDVNVPQMLADNAQHLREAIAKINDINTWYANQALRINPALRMSNGLVEVHKIPQIVQMMSTDMRNVLNALSRHYTAGKGSVAQPSPPTDPNKAPGTGNFAVGDPNMGDSLPYPNLGNLPNFVSAGPGVGGPDFGNGGAGDVPAFQDGDPGLGVNAPNLGGDSPGTNENVPDFGTGAPDFGTGAPDLGAGAADFGAATPDFGTGTPDFGTDVPGVGGPDAGTLGTGAPDAAPGDTSPDQDLARFPGDTSLENGGPDLPTTGQFDPAMDAALNPPAVVPAPDPGLGADTPANSVKSPKAAAAGLSPFPGDTGLDAPGSAEDPTGTAGAGVAPFPGTGTPDLDTAGTGAPGLGGLGSLPGVPDTGLGSGSGSGLGSGPGVGANSPLTNGTVQGFPGGTNLPDGSALGAEPGMPMMPMGGGSAGLGGAGGEVGAPDAAGLLGGDAEPWDGSAALPDGVSGGAEQGGPGLSLPGDQVAAGGPAEGGSLSGMPMMPMGGGSAGLGGAGGEVGAPDAAGLLGGDAEPWDGSAALPDGVTGGAEQGGPGLSLPGDGAAGEGPSAGGPSFESPSFGSPSLGGPAATGPAAEGASDGMPMMPMGGLGQPGGGDREHEHSEASGLLSGTTEPWANSFEGGDDSMGSAHGTPRDEGSLTMPDEDGPGADLFSGQPGATSPAGAPAGHLDTEEFLTGTAEWLPYLVASAGATDTGDSHAHATRDTSGFPGDPAAPVWGEAEAEHGQAPWAVAGAPEAAVPEAAAPEPERASREHRPAPQDDDTSHPDDIGAADAEVVPVAPVAPVAFVAPLAPVAVDAPVAVGAPVADDAPSADDAAAWDAAAASLLPLLAPGHGALASGEEAGTEGDRQDAAAATAVAAGAYTIARSTTADESFAVLRRAAWRPKATGQGLVELTCSFDDPPEEPQASAHDEAEAGRDAGAKAVRRERERDGEGGNSVADLLRQGEEVWG
ncbi:hypothetical protein ABZ832_17360 [Streptantibioticus parmotrematis]|uniref:WXG100 family type VII secretion target n=1 Tax=Streptantibioticus parmotrematis TaxID=2873249 RepID=UPI00340016DA